MTGMLNAVPKTPLHARLKEAGRLIAESVGDQFVFTNIVPSGMSRLEELIRQMRGVSADRRARASSSFIDGMTRARSLVVRHEDDNSV